MWIVSGCRSTPRLFATISRCPSLYYRADVKVFSDIDDRSLELLFDNALRSCEPLTAELSRLALLQQRGPTEMWRGLQAAMVAIHRAAEASQQPHPHDSESARLHVIDSKQRAFATVRSRFEELLSVFQVAFVYQHAKLLEQSEHVEAAMQELERVAAQANAQLAREIDGDTQLRDATRAVAQSADTLKAREQAERDAKRAFLLDEQRCAALQSEIERERAAIELELAETLPELAAATASLAQIDKHHITELKSFTSPPQLVRLVMQAVCVLLGRPPTWTEALRTLADIRFLERLRSFDRDHVDPSLIARAKLYTNHPDFSMDNMKRASLASTTLCKWVLAIVRYFEVMTRVAPTQRTLEHAERSFQAVDELVRAERDKLVSLELEINELRASHARAGRLEEELQRNRDKRVKWTSKVSEFSNVLAGWQRAVAKRHGKLKVQRTLLIERCVVVAATLVYGSAATASERSWLGTESRMIARARMGCELDVSGTADNADNQTLATVWKHWTLSGRSMAPELRQAVQTVRYADMPSVLESLLLADHVQKIRLRYPLLLDPLGLGSSWLKDRFELSGNSFSQSLASLPVERTGHANAAQQREDDVTATGPTLLLVLDAGDPALVNTIEKQVTQRTAPLVRSALGPDLLMIGNPARLTLSWS